MFLCTRSQFKEKRRIKNLFTKQTATANEVIVMGKCKKKHTHSKDIYKH